MTITADTSGGLPQGHYPFVATWQGGAMYLSAREIARRLGLTREQAQTLCATGLCGDAIETSGGARYDEAVVDELARRPYISSPTELGPPVDSAGLFIVRLGAWQPVADADREGTGYSVHNIGSDREARALDRLWIGGKETVDLIRAARDTHGGQPFIATVSTFIVAARLITDVHATGTNLRLDLAHSDAEWARLTENHRLRSGPGGPWVWWPAKKGKS